MHVGDVSRAWHDARNAYLHCHQNGEPTAIAIESIAPDGYNGEIKVITGIDNQGKILGTRVLSHQETPGLGDKIDLRVTSWILGSRVSKSPKIIGILGKFVKMVETLISLLALPLRLELSSKQSETP